MKDETLSSSFAVSNLLHRRMARHKYAEDESQIDPAVQKVTVDDAMTIERQVFITDSMIEAMKTQSSPKVSYSLHHKQRKKTTNWFITSFQEAARLVKQTLDKKYGRLWHVVIVQGQYWSHISHEPGYSMIFKVGRFIFLCWRTPGY